MNTSCSPPPPRPSPWPLNRRVASSPAFVHLLFALEQQSDSRTDSPALPNDPFGTHIPPEHKFSTCANSRRLFKRYSDIIVRMDENSQFALPDKHLARTWQSNDPPRLDRPPPLSRWESFSKTYGSFDRPQQAQSPLPPHHQSNHPLPNTDPFTHNSSLSSKGRLQSPDPSGQARYCKNELCNGGEFCQCRQHNEDSLGSSSSSSNSTSPSTSPEPQSSEGSKFMHEANSTSDSKTASERAQGAPHSPRQLELSSNSVSYAQQRPHVQLDSTQTSFTGAPSLVLPFSRPHSLPDHSRGYSPSSPQARSPWADRTSTASLPDHRQIPYSYLPQMQPIGDEITPQPLSATNTQSYFGTTAEDHRVLPVAPHSYTSASIPASLSTLDQTSSPLVSPTNSVSPAAPSSPPPPYTQFLAPDRLQFSELVSPTPTVSSALSTSSVLQYPAPTAPVVLTPPPPQSSDGQRRAPYVPFLCDTPLPDTWVAVETTASEYQLVVRLPGFRRDGIVLSTRRRRILHVVADSWEPGGGHFERRVSFGYDADLAQVRAEFDGELLRVIVPRRAAPLTTWSTPQ